MRFFLILLLVTHVCIAESDPQKVWSKLVGIVEKGDKEEVLKSLSGEIKNSVSRFGVEPFKRVVNKTWIQNKVIPQGDSLLFIHISQNNRKATALFRLEDKHWKFYELRQGFTKSKITPAQRNLQKQYAHREKEQLRYKMARIYQKVLENSRANPNSFIPKMESLKIDKDDFSYTCPRNASKHKLLFAEGHKFTNKSNYILAITETHLLSKHYALFEDGHIEEVPRNKFEKYASEIRTLKEGNSVSKADELKINKLVDLLGNQSFKERKKAKQELEQIQFNNVSFLKQKLKEQTDIEIKESLKEVIAHLEKRGPKRTPYSK